LDYEETTVNKEETLQDASGASGGISVETAMNKTTMFNQATTTGAETLHQPVATNMPFDYDQYERLLSMQTAAFTGTEGTQGDFLFPDSFSTSNVASNVGHTSTGSSYMIKDNSSVGQRSGPSLSFDTKTVSADKTGLPLFSVPSQSQSVSAPGLVGGGSLHTSLANTNAGNWSTTSTVVLSSVTQYPPPILSLNASLYSGSKASTSNNSSISNSSANLESVTGSALFYSSTLTPPVEMLSADAPEFVPRFPMMTGPSGMPPPRFCMPKYAGSPVGVGRPPFTDSSMYSGAPVMAQTIKPPMPSRTFERPNPPSPQNAVFNRFLGPNLFLRPPPSTSALSFAGAAAQTSKHKSESAPELPAFLRKAELQERHPCVEKIEKMVSEGRKVLVLMRGLPGSGKSYLAQYVYKHVSFSFFICIIYFTVFIFIFFSVCVFKSCFMPTVTKVCLVT
jgi:hypothetical protein